MGVEFRAISEIGLNDTLLVLEPSRDCIAHCTWCYAALNRKAAGWAGKSRQAETADSFARHVNRAFGPDYDPADFRQWALRNKLPITWASGVEPFQSVPQALATLEIIDRLDLVVFIQTRATNWREVWDAVKSRAGQLALYVSMPSDDPAYLKRYEPGTPSASERWALIDAAVTAGIPTMLAVAPYHPDWCPDPAGLVRRAIARGISAVFFDPLHLSGRQLEAATDPTLAALAASAWDGRTVAAAADAKAECVAAGMAWHTVGWRAPIHRLESTGDYGWAAYRDARPFGYVDDAFFAPLHRMTDADDAPPVALTFADALAWMEAAGPIDQPFAWSSLGHELIAAKTLPAAWVATLRPTATLAAYLRALWNDPRPNGFAWRHPFVRLAVRPGSGEPWLSPEGDAVMIFDPNHGPKRLRRVVDDLGAFRRLPAGGV
jgi:hypothetical protein